MKRLIVTLATLTLLTGVLAAPVSAITNGDKDEDGHPYVGLMTAIDEDGFALWRCTGTLIAPTLFLTAGHCVEAPAAHIEVWFSSGPVPIDPEFAAALAAAAPDDVSCSADPAFDGYPCQGDVGGTPHGHPDYDPNAFFLFDLGMVVLDEPMPMDTYGQLPALDQLDALKPRRSTTFTAVGYGRQRSFPSATSWKVIAIRERYVANPHLLQINTGFTGDFAMMLSNNANTGGTCFGDSGGPNFLGDSNVIAGVTSFGLNFPCGGTGGVYRIDRADDLNWINTFLD
ncbi:MAG TPA: trypsin-like serine protease [Candidatus Limnocylindrales bacterium]|nr:trypsin-like serine protease [Candidatus Limnocylindrales bacterium]